MNEEYGGIDSNDPIADGTLPTPEEPEEEELDAYGRCFGLAFQITDDLLDIEGSTAQTGTAVRPTKMRRNQIPYSTLILVRSSSTASRACKRSVTRSISSVSSAWAWSSCSEDW